MKPIYIAAGAALLLAAVIVGYAYPANSEYAGSNTSKNISAAINSTREYLNIVNKSAYVIFYPNMEQPYAYLDGAVNATSKKNYSDAYSLLAKARASASEQKSIIYKYRSETFWIMLVAFIASLAVLYFIMKPGGKRASG